MKNFADMTNAEFRSLYFGLMIGDPLSEIDAKPANLRNYTVLDTKHDGFSILFSEILKRRDMYDI